MLRHFRAFGVVAAALVLATVFLTMGASPASAGTIDPTKPTRNEFFFLLDTSGSMVGRGVGSNAVVFVERQVIPHSEAL